MQPIVTALRRFLLVIVVIALAWMIIANYSFVFAKKIKGEVLEVERVTQPTAMLGSGMTSEQLFSFAVMVKAFDGTIYSASSEDRQWAIAKKGYCVETKFFPYPPWNLEKDGTFFNARLVRVFECKGEAPAGWTSAQAAPTPTVPTPADTPLPVANPPVANPIVPPAAKSP